MERIAVVDHVNGYFRCYVGYWKNCNLISFVSSWSLLVLVLELLLKTNFKDHYNKNNE